MAFPGSRSGEGLVPGDVSSRQSAVDSQQSTVSSRQSNSNQSISLSVYQFISQQFLLTGVVEKTGDRLIYIPSD